MQRLEASPAGAARVRLQFVTGASLSGRTVDREGNPCGAYQLYLGRVRSGDLVQQVAEFPTSTEIRVKTGHS